jgi:hypothetical protein
MISEVIRSEVIEAFHRNHLIAAEQLAGRDWMPIAAERLIIQPSSTT